MIRENSTKSKVSNNIIGDLEFRNAQNYIANINVISKSILEILMLRRNGQISSYFRVKWS